MDNEDENPEKRFREENDNNSEPINGRKMKKYDC
jgi:hypothetical protein